MRYIYDDSSKNFNANLEGDKKPKCEFADCEKELKNLPECSQKNVTLSNGSCTPDKIINLDVPPGECQLPSICVFRTAGRVHVCVLVPLQANVVRKKEVRESK